MARARATVCSSIIPRFATPPRAFGCPRRARPSSLTPPPSRRSRSPGSWPREERLEPISYWMRIGYDNSNSNWARQALKLGYGLRGWIPDGALFRVSTVGIPAEESFKVQDKFIHDLLNSVDPGTREFMVGDPKKALL